MTQKTAVDRYLIPVGGAVIGLLVLALIVLVLLPDVTPAGPSASQPGASPAIVSPAGASVPTFPATWTPQATQTRFPSRTPADTPTVDATREAAQQNLMVMMQLKADGANGESTSPAQTFLKLDQEIVANPNSAFAYFDRGKAYISAAEDSNDETVYTTDLARALADLDRAIQLDPEQGNYFRYRGFIYWDEASIAKYRVDHDRLFGIALENMQVAARITPHGIGAQSNVFAILGNLGRCQEALDQEARLQAAGDYDPDSAVMFNRFMAQLDLCTGRYADAQAHIDQDIQDNGISCSASTIRTIILFNSGQSDAAFDEVSACIKRWPYQGGDRYFWRALIDYDRGQKDLAAQELQTGADNTWIQQGLNTYVQGLLARDAGDQQRAIELMQTAEASMNPYADGAAVLARVRRDLAALGGSPLEITPDESQFKVTEMP